MRVIPALCVFVLLSLTQIARASSVLPLTTAEMIAHADAVFRGTVSGVSVLRHSSDDLIYTRTSLTVDEPLKGRFPSVVQLFHRGGQLGNEHDFHGLSPMLRPGGEYLLFVIRGPNGRLQSMQGAASAIPLYRLGTANGDAQFASPGQEILEETRALTRNGRLPGSDVRDQAGTSEPSTMAITGMLNNVNARFVQPDRGEPIPYLIDAASLPTGMTLAQATNAVQQALNAWAAVTSLKFQLEAIGSFGQGADTISTNDGKIRIQLHDNYDRITGTGVLGIGGRGATSSPVGASGWDIGGNVNGYEFWKSAFGYVVLKHTNSSMQNLATFAEVLCHEIGHALNLAHSSENAAEPNTVLKEAIMYFQAHADGRGATLGAYDPPVIQQVYPFNTPPFTFSRVMDVVTAPSAPNVPGVNEVELRGYDLQTANLTFAAAGATAHHGSFSLAGTKVRFTPNGWYSDSPRSHPGGNSFYDVIYGRFSDGTNASPYARVAVVSLTDDGDSPSDGIPDSWMMAYFGHPNPQAGDQSRATDDADGDGLTNLQEFIAGMNPRDANSAQRITAFNLNSISLQAKAYELYQVLGSTNLASWTAVGIPFVPTNASLANVTTLPVTNIIGTIPGFPATNNHLFFRVEKVP